MNDAACPQVNTPGLSVGTQSENRAYESGARGTEAERKTDTPAHSTLPMDKARKTERFYLTSALEGATAAPRAPPPIPLETRCLVLNASGGEFRVVFHNNQGETRRRGAPCLTIVFGQNQNSRSVLGVGNPCEEGPLLFTTSVERMLVARSDTTVKKTWWVHIDDKTGWVNIGAGKRPSAKTVLLSGRLADSRHLRWSHVSFANWQERVDLTCSFASDRVNPVQLHQDKFDPFHEMRRFEGLTLVSHHSPEQQLHQAMLALQGLLRGNPLLAPHFALLPPPSFHVTCMGLLTFTEEYLEAYGYDRSEGHGHPPSANSRLARISASVNECWSLLPPTLTFQVVALRCRGNSVVLRPDPPSAAALAEWREAIFIRCPADCMVPDDPGYTYHSTFAYQLYPIISKEANAALEAYSEAAMWMLQSVGPITLRAPDLCTFRDMGEFVPTSGQGRVSRGLPDRTTTIDEPTARRVASDGVAYTRQEFFEYYGGHAEWDAAAEEAGGAELLWPLDRRAYDHVSAPHLKAIDALPPELGMEAMRARLAAVSLVPSTVASSSSSSAQPNSSSYLQQQQRPGDVGETTTTTTICDLPTSLLEMILDAHLNGDVCHANGDAYDVNGAPQPTTINSVDLDDRTEHSIWTAHALRAALGTCREWSRIAQHRLRSFAWHDLTDSPAGRGSREDTVASASLPGLPLARWDQLTCLHFVGSLSLVRLVASHCMRLHTLSLVVRESATDVEDGAQPEALTPVGGRRQRRRGRRGGGGGLDLSPLDRIEHLRVLTSVEMRAEVSLRTHLLRGGALSDWRPHYADDWFPASPPLPRRLELRANWRQLRSLETTRHELPRGVAVPQLRKLAVLSSADAVMVLSDRRTLQLQELELCIDEGYFPEGGFNLFSEGSAMLRSLTIHIDIFERSSLGDDPRGPRASCFPNLRHFWVDKHHKGLSLSDDMFLGCECLQSVEVCGTEGVIDHEQREVVIEAPTGRHGGRYSFAQAEYSDS